MADSIIPRELANVFRFLARVWLNEPDETVLSTWQTVLPLLPDSDGNDDQAEESPADLQIEYCRLFIGPRDHLPPYQSVWQTGQLGGPASISMERYLERSGFDRESLNGDVPADHLGLQLDLFGWLLEQQSEDSEPDASAVLMEFHDAHLLWPDEFLARVKAASQSDFYRSVASITHQLLNQQD